ncbi:MAG: HlyD family efflux transporter periplasmic adaptor subunit, partial [Myxococcota bacterium]
MYLREPALFDDQPTMHLPVQRMVGTHRFVRWLAKFLLGAFGATLLLMLLAPWQQTSRGIGRVVAYSPMERQQVLGAPVKGRILKWYVTEGSMVKKGQLIAAMTDNDPQALRRLEQQRKAIQDQLGLVGEQAKAYENKNLSLGQVRKLHLRANQLKIRMTQQKYKAAVQKMRAFKAALNTAQLNLKRLMSLKKDDIVSKRDLEVAELKVAKLQNELSVARANLTAAQSEIIATRALRLKKAAEDQSKLDSVSADLRKTLNKAAYVRSELAKIDLKLARQSSQFIRAPVDAVVLSLQVAQGSEMLKAGDSIATIVPSTSDFAVELWIDGNDVPLITRGRHVRLQFEGWPAIQ